MEAKGVAGGQPQGNGSHGPVATRRSSSIGALTGAAFKPEFGYSQRGTNGYAMGTSEAIFTTNPDFWSRNIYYAGTRSQSQKPIGAFEGHLSYDFKPRLWVSLDGNFQVQRVSATNSSLEAP